MTQGQEKKQSIKTDPEMAQMLGLARKDLNPDGQRLKKWEVSEVQKLFFF